MVVGTKCPEITGLDFLKGSAPSVPPKDGSPAIIEMWASWCGPCRQVFPHLSDIARKHRDRRLTVVGVTSEARSVGSFVDQMGSGMDYVVARDAAGDCQRKLAGPAGVRGIPHAFVVAGDRTILYSGHPMDPKFDAAVEKAVAEAKPAKVKVALVPVSSTREELLGRSVRELKAILTERGLSLAGLAEKGDIVDRILELCTGSVTNYTEVDAAPAPSAPIPSVSAADGGPAKPRNVVCEDGVCRVVGGGENNVDVNEGVSREGTAAGAPPSISPDEIQGMKIGELKRALQAQGVSTSGFVERSEFVEALKSAL